MVWFSVYNVWHKYWKRANSEDITCNISKNITYYSKFIIQKYLQKEITLDKIYTSNPTGFVKITLNLKNKVLSV